jgi:hypothetical protein
LLGAERGDQCPELTFGPARPVVDQSGGHRPLATSGEHGPVPASRAGAASATAANDRRGRPFSPAICASLISRRQPCVPGGVAGEDEQVPPVGIRRPGRVSVAFDGELGAEHRRQRQLACGFGEAHHTVEA